MKIRAHHLLCIRSFKGLGYSKEFVDNFSKVIEKIKNDEKIKVITSPDAVCSKCPHNQDGCVKKGPDSEKRVKEHDLRILKAAGIDEGSEGNSLDLLNKVKKIKKEDVPVICKDCSWKKNCV